ncbi:MAG: transglycosylase domain-containing protein [Ktedonobacterales bacterium]|nr:transglycosylase domain-containing protein [Ktedonobacterales bacterium]
MDVEGPFASSDHDQSDERAPEQRPTPDAPTPDAPTPDAERPLAGDDDQGAADDDIWDDEDDRWADEDATDDEDATYPLPQPLPRSAVARRGAAQRRTSRRRRHYIFYVRRMSRSRQAARSVTVTRAAWISVVALAVVALSSFTATLGLAASYYQSQTNSIAALSRTVAARDSLRIFDSRGVLLYELKNAGAQHSISLAQIPVTVVNATVAIEDRTFWVNQGVDVLSIIRAAVANYNGRRITQGASTITQQLVKRNILNSNETFDRKVREAILAIGMTTQGVYTKRQIMQIYLNSIPYGQEAYGIDAAAQAYFSYQDDPATGETAAQRLDLAQAAMLSGIPQNPNTNNPLLHPKAAHERQRVVLDSMVTYGYITRAQANAAYAEAGKPNFFNPQQKEQNLAPHFVAFIQTQISNMIAAGQLDLSRSGLNIYTTLDLDMQNNVQQAMKNHLYGNDLDDYGGGGLIRNDNVTNSAAIIANQHDGSIKVLLGSVDYYSTRIDGKFDVATQGFRGPGSSFKPIVYSAAFEKGWFPAMTVADQPTVFWDQGQDKPYKVLDFNPNKFFGTVTLRQALQFSLNIPAVKVMQYVGVDEARRNAMRMGINTWEGSWGLSSVLGSLDVRLYDMVQAYTVLANYGQYIPLHSINTITDSSGDVLYQYRTPRPVQVLSPQVAYMLTSILSDNPARIGEFGPCSPLYLDEKADCQAYGGNSPNARPAATKTGTGQNFWDDWTMGYTMDYTMGVWAGNNNHTPMRRIDGVTGAAPIWYNSMLYAERNLPKTPFPVPTGLRLATYTTSGITSRDWFLAGPLPVANIGNTGPATPPCITLTEDPQNPWNYCAATPTVTPGVTPKGTPSPPSPTP